MELTQKTNRYYSILNLVQNYLIEYESNKNRLPYALNQEAYTRLKLLCDQTIIDYGEIFESIVRDKNIYEVYKAVYESQGLCVNKISWGRIIAIISFSAWLYKNYKQELPDNCSQKISEVISDIVAIRHANWLNNQYFCEGLYKPNNVTRMFKLAIHVTTLSCKTIICIALCKLIFSTFLEVTKNNE